MSEQQPIIETRGLTRQFRSGPKTITVLDDVTVSIARGEVVAVMGPSGSGKSTLLALLAGLDRPTEGSVVVDGEAIESMSEDKLALLRRRKIGFVFQSFHLLGNFTALENVMLPLELLGERSPRAMRRVTSWRTVMVLGPERKRRVRLRVSIAGGGWFMPWVPGPIMGAVQPAAVAGGGL